MMRLLLGVTFCFSGFVKGIDPWGTLYKFNEYLAATNLNIWPNLVLVAVFALCALEFTTGVFLLLGCWRRTTSISAYILMCIMLPLSLWIAIKNPVADCGCFGDALQISNWATFWKNVLLFAASTWLLKFNQRAQYLITPALQWIAFILSAIYIVGIGLIGYLYQPLIDFRPFKVGTSVIAANQTADSSPRFRYTRNGETRDFASDSLPDESEGWEYLERIEAPVSSLASTSQKQDNFKLWDGDEEISSEAIPSEGGALLLLMPKLKEVSIATTWKINTLYNWCAKHNVAMLAAVAGTPQEIEEWNDLSLPDYPIYTAEDTEIKMLARGNPALVYLENGTVKWKRTLGAINIDQIVNNEQEIRPSDLLRNDSMTLRNISLIYLSILAILLTGSFLSHVAIEKKGWPRLRLSRLHKKPIHDDKAHSAK